MYDFRCDACGAQFDKQVKLSDPTPCCPECGAGGEAVHKLLSAPGFVLKGGGWYKDHYGLKSSSSGSDGAGGGASGGDGD